MADEQDIQDAQDASSLFGQIQQEDATGLFNQIQQVEAPPPKPAGWPADAPWPPPVKTPLPAALQPKPQPKPAAPPPNVDPKASAFTNYMRGVPMEQLGMPGIVGKVANMPRSGVGQVKEGFQQATSRNIRDPEFLPNLVGGGSKMVRGAGTAIAPAALPLALYAAPVATAAGLVTGGLGAAGTEAGLNWLGVRPEYAAGAGDVAGAVTGGLGAKAGSAFQGWLSGALRRGAEKNYMNVLRNPEAGQVPVAEETARLMANERVIGRSRKALQERMAEEKKVLGPQAEAAYAGKPNMNPASVFDAIEGLRRQHATVQGAQGEVITNPELNTALQNMQADLRAMAGPDGKIPPQALDQYRDQLFKGTVGPMGKMRQTAPATASEMETASARAIKNAMDSEYPDAQKINDAYKMRAKVWNFLELARRRTVAAETGQPKAGPAANLVAKAGMKGMAKAVGLVDMPFRVFTVVDSVPWNTVSGAIKAKAADYLARGAWDNFTGLMKPFIPKAPPPAPAPPLKQITAGSFKMPPVAEEVSMKARPGQYGRELPRLGPGREQFRMPRAETGPTYTPPKGYPEQVFPPERRLGPGLTRPASRAELGSAAGDVTDLVPVKDPVTGEITYIPRPQRRSGPIRLGQAKGGIFRQPTRGEVLGSLGR